MLTVYTYKRYFDGIFPLNLLPYNYPSTVSSTYYNKMNIYCQVCHLRNLCFFEGHFFVIIHISLVKVCTCFVREATKKNDKKFHTLCKLSKWNGNPPPPAPFFTTISASFRTWKLMLFAMWMRGIDKNKIGDLFKVKL